MYYCLLRKEARITYSVQLKTQSVNREVAQIMANNVQLDSAVCTVQNGGLQERTWINKTTRSEQKAVL